jgi:hypothetical protein
VFARELVPPDVDRALVQAGEPAAARGVLGQARAEVPGFADVEQLVIGREEEVDPRTGRRRG